MTSRLIKTLCFIATLAAATLLQVTLSMAEGDSRASGPRIELPTDAEKCIRPTDYMRRNHMNLLLHKRDATMRQGIRKKDASLQGCVDCHSKNDDKGVAIPVNADGQFCSTCHEYAAVKLDCFECHRTTPDVPASTASIPDIPAHADLLAQNSTEVQQLRSYLEEVN